MKNPIPNNKPFQKGQSGNPNGRPKNLPMINEMLAEVLSDEVNGIDAAKRILMAIVAKALKGDLRAAELLLDRAYGKAKQKMEVDASFQTFDVEVTPEKIREIKKIFDEKY
jgi:Family of unknown function (DUF5681)